MYQLAEHQTEFSRKLAKLAPNTIASHFVCVFVCLYVTTVLQWCLRLALVQNSVKQRALHCESVSCLVCCLLAIWCACEHFHIHLEVQM